MISNLCLPKKEKQRIQMQYICGITKSGKLRMGIRMETILKKVNNGSCNAD